VDTGLSKGSRWRSTSTCPLPVRGRRAGRVDPRLARERRYQHLDRAGYDLPPAPYRARDGRDSLLQSRSAAPMPEERRDVAERYDYLLDRQGRRGGCLRQRHGLHEATLRYRNIRGERGGLFGGRQLGRQRQRHRGQRQFRDRIRSSDRRRGRGRRRHDRVSDHGFRRTTTITYDVAPIEPSAPRSRQISPAPSRAAW
jgi:hypothetical protein